jgi:glycine reductase
MEKAGVPVAQVTPLAPVARAVGSNRIIKGRGIAYPLGDPEVTPGEERELRRQVVLEALEALTSPESVCP